MSEWNARADLIAGMDLAACEGESCQGTTMLHTMTAAEAVDYWVGWLRDNAKRLDRGLINEWGEPFRNLADLLEGDDDE